MNNATPQKRHRPLLRKWLLYLLIAAVVLYGGNIVINRVIEKKAALQLQQASPNLHITFSGIHANFLTSHLVIDDAGILITPASGDTVHKPYIHFSKISLAGVRFLKLVLKKEIAISEITLDGGAVTVDSSFFNDSSTHYDIKMQQDFTSVAIGRFIINPANVWVAKGTTKTMLLGGDAVIDNIHVSKRAAKGLPFGAVRSNLTNIHYASAAMGNTVDIKRMVVDSRHGLVQIDTLQLSPLHADTAKNKNVMPAGVEATIADIHITGLDWLKLADKKFIATAVVVNQSKAAIAQQPSTTSNSNAMPAALKRMMAEITVDTFRFTNTSLTYKGPLPGSTKNKSTAKSDTGIAAIRIKYFEAGKINISVQGDKTMQAMVDTLGISNIQALQGNISIAGVEGSASGLQYTLPGQYSKLYVGRLTVSSKKQLLHISELKIIPQCTKEQLGARLGHQADYTEAEINTIDIIKLDVAKLAEGTLAAGKISIDGCRAYIYRDRRLPRPLQQQPLPVSMLNKLPMLLRVGAFTATHVAATYEEFPKDGTKTGTLQIVRGQLEISPFFNRAGTGHMDMHVTGSIMGSGTVEANIYMPVQDSNYRVKGVIKDLSLTALQSSAENLGKFHIQSGILNSLFFEFAVDETKASGKIIGEYHDLVIEKLKGNDKKVAWAPTLALKSFIIPKNKDASKPERNRTGTIDYTRDNTRSVSFYLLKALLSGVRDSFTFGFLLPK